MKLVIQIPCYNEEETLPSVLKSIPTKITGVDVIETLVIDDGSTDGTAQIAKDLGVTRIVRNDSNKGLAKAFSIGLDNALEMGADIIVNTDGDNQYASEDIGILVRPIVDKEAEIVIGDRGGISNPNFTFMKRCLQVLGSAVVRAVTGVKASDAVSGFRAISRDAAMQLNIVSGFSYTIEMLIQSGNKRLKVVSVPIRSYAKTRESRLFNSIPHFISISIATLIRTYTMYKPLKVFFIASIVVVVIGIIPVVRFLLFYFRGEGSGHIQSLVLGSMFILLGALTFMVGVVADLINFNRRLIEKNIMQSRRLEQRMMNLESHFDKAPK